MDAADADAADAAAVRASVFARFPHALRFTFRSVSCECK